MSEVERLVADSLDEQELIGVLEQRGYVVHRPEPPAPKAELDVSRLRGDRVRIGVVSDLHFGSKWQQPTYLREHYRYFRKRRVQAVLIPGDITDGASSMHAGFEYEVWAHGFDAQKQAALEAIPDIGVPQYLIAGNHDASHWKASGADIVQAICSERDDLNYLGGGRSRFGSVGYVEVGGVLIQLCHPHLGITRQRSYRLETWIERLQPPRPRLVVMGNFHKTAEIYDEGRNCWGIMVPSFQAQSNWMASKGISSVVGSCILEFGTATKGLAPSLSIEWLLEYEPRPNDWPGGAR
jgi:predicted phosphodiesterase